MSYRFFTSILLSLALCTSASAIAATCQGPNVRGINLVPLPTGWHNGAVELVFPTAEHISYYRGVGMNTIRLPISWETIQPELYGDLNLRYLTKAFDFLDKANNKNMKVVIDLHNYGRYRGKVVGTADVPNTAFRDLWERLARVFSKKPAVYAYGLMNEPHDTDGNWHKAAQFGVDGVRGIDRERFIYVAGDSWSNSQRWPDVNRIPFVSDPSDKVVYEAHIYFDDDFSGRYKFPIGSTNMETRSKQRLQPFIDWLKKYNQKGVIGEVGVPMGDERWLVALQSFLDNSDEACLGWFLWAGGSWRESYELSLEPIQGLDRPQIKLLKEWISRQPRLQQ